MALRLGYRERDRGGAARLQRQSDQSHPPEEEIDADDQTNRPGAGTSRGILYDVVVGSGDAGLTPCDGGSLPDGAAPGTASNTPVTPDAVVVITATMPMTIPAM